ncbi:MAG: response regulator transcription factor [Flavobacteriaceae bacterium]|jgi:two-component system alkaline phosphatase synthesis response regulator PhoP
MKKEDIKILLVDDEPDIIEIIRFNLSQEGYQILSASDGLEALKVAEKHLPHLIILDVMMPNMDGIEACEQLRKDPRFVETIIMFLTARGEEYSYVAAFEAGADDYVTKPIKPKVLTSKVKGLLRRFKKNQKSENRLLFDGLVIDREAYKVILNDQEMSLPRKEFELFYLLASKPDKVFGRDEIMDKVWGGNVVVGDRTIDVHIRKLREKIGQHYFKTIKGIGYKFNISEKLEL